MGYWELGPNTPRRKDIMITSILKNIEKPLFRCSQSIIEGVFRKLKHISMFVFVMANLGDGLRCRFLMRASKMLEVLAKSLRYELFCIAQGPFGLKWVSWLSSS